MRVVRSRFGTVLLGTVALLGAVAAGTAARAASHEGAPLAAARALYAEGLLESAAAELRDLAAAGADAETRAAALQLLGRIAVDQGRYGEALELWSDLSDRYPRTAAASEAATGRRLLEELVACRGEAGPQVAESPAAGADPSPAADEPTLEPTDEPTAERAAELSVGAREAPAPTVAGPAAPAATPPPPSTPPVAEAPAVTPPPAPRADAPSPPAAASEPPARGAAAGLVLVAGRGEPYDAVRETIGLLTEFVAARGVRASSPAEGIALVEESRSALDRLLAAAREQRAASLLHVRAQYGHRERIVVECYRPDGELLWREKVTGGTGWREESLNEKLVRRAEGKLEPRIGGPGLPVGAADGR